MTYQDDPSSNARQRMAPYPSNFILAVKPDEVTTAGCNHEASPPVCHCVHDWRVEWGNVAKRSVSRSKYVTVT